MERIASFQVDHTRLLPGLYLSRCDGNVHTFDLRFKKPNTGDLLTNSQMHSVEHLLATLLRNAPEKESVIYFGPMGCQTGFYFLFDSLTLSDAQAIGLLQRAFAQAADALSQSAPCPAPAQKSAATIAIWICRQDGKHVPGMQN